MLGTLYGSRGWWGIGGGEGGEKEGGEIGGGGEGKWQGGERDSQTVRGREKERETAPLSHIERERSGIKDHGDENEEAYQDNEDGADDYDDVDDSKWCI